MKAIILGTAGYHPNESRQTTSVFFPVANVALDAGTSFFRLPQYLVGRELDILLSHAHLDHVVGLTYLLDILHQCPLDHVRVWGDGKKLEAIREHLFATELFPVPPPFESCPIRGPIELSGGATAHAFPLEHPGGSLGYRIEFGDRTAAMVTDTTASDAADYAQHISGVDLLIHECNFHDGAEQLAEKTGHSCLTPVLKLARRADVGQLVLLHFNPLHTDPPVDLERVREIFPRTTLAKDRLEIEF